MSKHGLDRMDVSSPADQMGCKRMAERMGRDICLDTGLLPIILDYLPESLPAHGPAAAVGEQPRGFLAL